MNETPNIQQLKNTLLWKKFILMCNDINKIAMVENLVKYVDSLLDRIIETFPTYTLHNGLHALNVIKNMENLLQEENINKLSDLEAAILILSAYLHDVGMVFSEDELSKIEEEEDFKIFLNNNPEIKLKFLQLKKIDKEIAETYCRYMHAKRIHLFLKDVGDEKLKWDNISIREILGYVCENHNEDATLIKHEKFSTNYLATADLKMCAIILRLADILDFDNTRAPEVVYRYLGLKKSTSPMKKISDIEWRKHLSSSGFIFPMNKKFEINFIAGPDHPAVEDDVREFLDIIEHSFEECRNLLSFCSDKWRNLELPLKINRNNIISQNYKYGKFYFSLNQEQITNLLMGESLYTDNKVFIRELLQNSIDTCRHRMCFEEFNNNLNYEPEIRTYSWTDEEGYNWFRIDDNGMGMNENIIVNYFLNLGKSFYKSPEFQIEKLDYVKQTNKDFTPISKFGIGVLSCCLISDKIEINTKHLSKETKDNPIRFSISGAQNFYFLQSKHNIPAPFPSYIKSENNELYRKQCGTSIAIRIDPSKEFNEVNFEKILKNLILFCPINVYYNDKLVNQEIDKKLNTELIDSEIIYLDENNERLLKKFFRVNQREVEYNERTKFKVFPLNISKFSTHPNLKGQGIFTMLFFPDELLRIFETNGNNLIISFDKNYILHFILKKEKREIKIHLKDNKVVKYVNRIIQELKSSELSNNMLEVSHNGIALPDIFEGEYIYSKRFLKFDFSKFQSRKDTTFDVPLIRFHCYLALQDKINFDISASRELIKNIPWNTLSNIILSIFFSISNIEKNIFFKNFDFFNIVFVFDKITLGDLANDNNIIEQNLWRNVKLFNSVTHSNLSLNEILLKINEGEEINLTDYYHFKDYSFTGILKRALLDFNCEVILRMEGNQVKAKVNKRDTIIDSGKYVFPPMFFVKYERKKLLKFRNLPLNENHAFSQWYLKNAMQIKTNYPSAFYLINNILNTINRLWENKLIVEVNIVYINQILKRLQLQNELNFKVTNEVFLKMNDFVVDIQYAY